MKLNPMGLRAQLLGGLVIIICGATISIGAVTVWANRRQSTQLQIAHGRMLGHSLAAVLGSSQSQPAQLMKIVSRVTGGGVIRHLDVIDRQARVLASSRHPVDTLITDRIVLQCIGTKEQMIEAVDDAGPLLRVSTPIIARGRLAGAVRLELPVGEDDLRWSVIFWILMGIDGLLLIVFAGIFVTRYVIRPVESMQQAASQVARGDLSVRLTEQGVRELSSLAESFNSMTESVHQQLERLERQREQLAASREQVIHSEKLASVGRLAAGLAHEVGNPLQSIIGFTEVLAKGGIDAREQRDLLDRIERETQRIHRIIRELLDYARPVEVDIEEVSLDQVVQQALQLVGPLKKMRQVVVSRADLEELPVVAASFQRMVQVMVNLLLNAADAMAGEGTIDIRGSLLDKEQRVVLCVSNTGPLIEADDRHRIFDPFFTTKEPGEGTGLGLSVAQAIVQSYGGSLRLTTDPQTTFVIELRCWKGAAVDPGG